MTECPACAGYGQAYRLVHVADGLDRNRTGIVPCSTCNGSGRITAALARHLATAERHRQDRVDRKVSLRDEAAVLGITPRELGDREHGRAPWPEES